MVWSPSLRPFTRIYLSYLALLGYMSLDYGYQIVCLASKGMPDDDPNKPEILELLELQRRHGPKLHDVDCTIARLKRTLELTPHKFLARSSHYNDLLAILRRVSQSGGGGGTLSRRHLALNDGPCAYPPKNTPINRSDSAHTRFARDRIMSDRLPELDRIVEIIRRAVEPHSYADQPEIPNDLGVTYFLAVEGVIPNVVSSAIRVYHLVSRISLLNLRIGRAITPVSSLEVFLNGLHACALEHEGCIDIQRILDDVLHVIPDRHHIRCRARDIIDQVTSPYVWLTGEVNVALAIILALQRWRTVESAHSTMPSGYEGPSPSLDWQELSDLIAASTNPESRECAMIALQLAVNIGDNAGSWLSEALMTFNLGSHGLHLALATLCCTIELLPNEDVRLIRILRELGSILCLLFERTGHINYLLTATSVFRRTIDVMSEDNPGKPSAHLCLGLTLQMQFELDPREQYIHDSLTNFVAFIENQKHPHSPLERLEVATRCVKLLADNVRFSYKEWTLIRVHSLVMNIVPDVAWPGDDIRERFRVCAIYAPLVTGAINAAIDARDWRQAIEWVAMGRSLVLLQIRFLRDLRLNAAQLKESHSEHHEKLIKLISDLKRAKKDYLRRTMNRDEVAWRLDARYHELRREYDRVLASIRICTGFQSFMRPMRLQCLTSLISDNGTLGYVVFINFSTGHGDALVLKPSGDSCRVPLPHLTLKCARNLRSVWYQYAMEGRGVVPRHELPVKMDILGPVLQNLWVRIVEPILSKLELITDPIKHDEDLPHITWCPSGPLMQLPLHAAGLYTDNYRMADHRTYKYVVSSYTPSLRTLVDCYDGVARQGLLRPHVLVVTQPRENRALNLKALPQVVEESDRMRHIFEASDITTKLLVDRAATRTSVKKAIVEDRHSWVHFACHGSQQRNDPTRSAFMLHNGPLSLLDLMSIKAEHAEFAFLSACQTATGDDNIADESVHLAAGMLALGFKSVVGTMWGMADEDGPVIVKAFYEELSRLRSLKLMTMGGAVPPGSIEIKHGRTGAAYALHKAMGILRETVGERKFLHWAPFVHLGV